MNADTISLFDQISSDVPVSAGDITISKFMWLKYAQDDGLSDLKTCMRSGKSHSLIKQLNTTFDDEGIIRCVGRYMHADLPVQTSCPILLPWDHDVTRLIVREIHERLIHSGVSHTLSQIRREYWIPRGRAVVRRVRNQCVVCRKYKGRQFALPQMPPWPRERLARSTPFQFIGLDYLGPINVSEGGQTVKMWICLMTCLAVRAVHLEFVRDCSAQCFVDCLSRFIARRGSPEQIISDNAPQFRVAKNIFDKAWHGAFNDELTCSYLSRNGIQWKYTTELSPWQGGFYERLVGLVKQTFRMEIGRKLLKWDELITLITEVEAVVNSRPLTYVYEDFPSGFVLRPCDFLTEQSTGIPNIDPAAPPVGGEASKNLIRFWKFKQRRLDRLWEYWYDEYLLTLRERGHLNHRSNQTSVKSLPFVNQTVLVKNPGAPRGSWKLGRIGQLITSNDGHIRSVELVLPNGVTIRRSVSHLYPLEIESELNEDPPPGVEGGGAVVNSETIDDEIDLQNDDDDAFSGFSESEVYDAEQRVAASSIHLATNSTVQSVLLSALMPDAVTVSFSQRPQY